MRKYLLGIAAVLVAVFAMNPATASAQDAANYTAEFSATNFYANDALLGYHFTGLDTTADYVWLLQGIDENNDPIQALAMKFHSGATTASPIWSGEQGDFDRGDGTLYTGAARVIDNFGNELGRHYILAGCSDSLSLACGYPGLDWQFNLTAVNGIASRFVIGKNMNTTDLNADNYFHPYKNQNAVITQQGGITFLHYSATTPGTDELRIRDTNTGDVVLRIEIADLVTYNTDVRNSVLTPWHVNASFVVLNTAGSELSFINDRQEVAAFNQVGSGDNPHTAIIEYGAYDYHRYTSGGTWVNDGESILLVNNNRPAEWEIKNNQDQISESGQLRLELESHTEAIWDSRFLDHKLEDSVEGVQDTDNYAFQRRRNDVYTVSGVSQVGVVTTWSITPTVHNAVAAALAHRRFEVDFTYEISNVVAVADRVEEVLNGFGMDTPLGRGLAMLVIMGVVIIAVAKQGAKGIIPFGMIYLAVGGAWLALGLGDAITTILFGISAVVLIFLMINSRKSEGGLEG